LHTSANHLHTSATELRLFPCRCQRPRPWQRSGRTF
jgi:hypothetical protein